MEFTLIKRPLIDKFWEWLLLPTTTNQCIPHHVDEFLQITIRALGYSGNLLKLKQKFGTIASITITIVYHIKNGEIWV